MSIYATTPFLVKFLLAFNFLLISAFHYWGSFIEGNIWRSLDVTFYPFLAIAKILGTHSYRYQITRVFLIKLAWDFDWYGLKT